MRTGLAMSREVAGLERVDQVVRRFQEHWRQGPPELNEYLEDPERVASVSLLAALVKADLRCRFEHDERPAVSDYLERFPALRSANERVLSLLYEEYCLREERGERPDTAEFCAQYEPWKDSLESQLRYHRVLSQVIAAAPPAPRFPEPGERFRHFLIGEELGRGGAGRVYRARDETLGGKEVALKVSRDRGSEPSIMGQLVHPHIMPVNSVVDEDCDGTKLRGLCMPYLPGAALDKVIARVNPGSKPRGAHALFDAIRGGGPEEPLAEGPGWSTFPTRGTYAEGVAWVVAVIAEAIAHAHKKKIYHRDIKPANILLTFREGPQLLDFNLSHDPNSAIEAEAMGRGGTLPYMAPEQLDAFIDPERWNAVAEPADLYSLGLVLREMLTGREPETSDPMPSLPRVIRALLDLRGDYSTDLRQLNPTVPHALEAIAGRCLAFTPADRYPGASELADDLRRFLAHRPLKYVRNPSVRERASNWSRRHRVLVAGVVLTTAIAGMTFMNHGALAIETRPEFTSALEELKRNRNDVALVKLRLLGPKAAALPLPSFYAALAHARADHYKAADSALRQMWLHSDAEARLLAWGRTDKAVAGEAEFIGRKVLALLPRFEEAEKPDVCERLERILRLALRLDPASEKAAEALPLPSFYAALAHARAKHYSEADSKLKQMWLQPDAEVRLLAWGRTHEAFAGEAAIIGRKVLALLPRFEEAEKPDVYERLERICRLALRLDPESEKTKEALANIDEGRGRFESAYKAWTERIESFPSTPETLEDKKRLASAFLTRARVSTNWTVSLLNRPISDEPSANLEGRLAEALKDVDRSAKIRAASDEALKDEDRGAEILGATDEVWEFDLNYIRCETLLALEALSRHRGRDDDADQFFQQAEQVLRSMAKPPEEREAPYPLLVSKFKERRKFVGAEGRGPHPLGKPSTGSLTLPLHKASVNRPAAQRL